MDEARQLSISSALREYQQVVRKHNVSTLKILVEGLTLPPKNAMTDQAADMWRFAVLGHLLSITLTGKITELQQVLSMDLEFDIDGVSHEPVDSRQTWFAAISAEMSEASLDVAFPPPELSYLCSLTNAVHGPGLPYWQRSRYLPLLSPASFETPEDTLLRVAIPARGMDQDSWLDEDDWREQMGSDEVTVGVRIGDKCEGSGASYVLYCCKNGIWAWRYAVHDEQWISDLYDTLEAYLEFYSHFCEPTEQETRNAVRRFGARSPDRS
ncbi:hypothetical protein AMS68_004195 [Peltaster fructicola]|uniref:Knr4/Smi1-like domain-containing protein n=1 Tax=Peltaster fructicola TaxID=286661 RepID=A0A6H0XVP3_9PEZI|nr:hypothetical protein AMS68_004195 [Peltaster fructicola]